jgi:hypothetical protein
MERDKQKETTRLLKLKLRSMEKKLSSMKMEECMEKFVVDKGLQDLLKRLFSKKKKHYTFEEKQLAITLRFYSKRGYNKLRTLFPLPHPRSIQNWLSCLHTCPGVLDLAMKALEVRRKILEAQGKPLILSLKMDEMYLRADLTLLKDGTVIVGWKDHGQGRDPFRSKGRQVRAPDQSQSLVNTKSKRPQKRSLPSAGQPQKVGPTSAKKLKLSAGSQDRNPRTEDQQLEEIKGAAKELLATQALVFMVVGVNDHFKLPVAYYFVGGLTAEERKELIVEVLKRIDKTGAEVVSAVSDGASIRAFGLLGVNLRAVKNGSTLPEDCSFPHPCHPDDPKKRVFALHDACHLLKLMRNILGEKEELIWDGKVVSWSYIVRLHRLQSFHARLLLANKLHREHIEFKANIMDVRLAVQTLSNLVACGLDLCRERGYQFQGKDFSASKPTADWLRLLNDVFDILNSRRLSDSTDHG